MSTEEYGSAMALMAYNMLTDRAMDIILKHQGIIIHCPNYSWEIHLPCILRTGPYQFERNGEITVKDNVVEYVFPNGDRICRSDSGEVFAAPVKENPLTTIWK